MIFILALSISVMEADIVKAGTVNVEGEMIESGISYNAQGQFKEAISEFNKVIEANPRNAAAYNFRGY